MAANAMPTTAASPEQAQGNCGLTHEMNPRGVGLPGRFLNISNTFTNQGPTDARIVVIVVDSSFGRYGSSTQYGMLNSTIPGVTIASPPPIMVPAGSKVEYDLPLFIPDEAQPGDYNATSFAFDQCFNSASSNWSAPVASLHTSAILTVTYPLWVQAASIGTVAAVLATLAVIIGLRVSKPKEPRPHSPRLPSYIPSD